MLLHLRLPFNGIRVVGSRYEALVEGKWLAVPPETVVEVRTIQQDAPLCVGYRGRGFLAL